MNKIIFNTFFLCLLLISFTLQQPSTIVASYIISGLYLIASRKYIRFTRRSMMMWGLVSFACMLPVLSFNHGIAPLFYLIFTPLLILAAKHFASHSLEHIILCLRNIFWIFAFVVIAFVLTYWDEPVPLEGVIPGSSTNALPSYLIVVQIAYSLAYYLKNNRLPVFSSVATLIVAIFGLGRASMIVSVLIFIFSIFVNTIISKSDRKIFFSTVGISIIPASIYFYENYHFIFLTVDNLIEGSKFSGGILDEHRGKQIDDYISKLDAWTLIFGADYNGTSINQYYGGKPDSTYIRTHAFYGMVGLLIIFVSLLTISLSSKIRIQKIVSLILISMTLLRASTDTIFFPSTLDFFYFLYFFIFLQFASGSKLKKETLYEFKSK